MSGAARPSKIPKTYHFHAKWEEDFLVFFKLHLSDLSNFQCYSDEGEC